MNKKSLLGFFFISLLLASFIFSANLVLAQGDIIQEGDKTFLVDVDGTKTDVTNDPNFNFGDKTVTKPDTSSNSFSIERLKNVALIDLWLNGYKSANFSIAGEFVKIMLLILMIILVQCSLNYVKFPESTTAQIFISVIVGILATFLISTETLLTSLTSFTALGTAIWIFLPILVLTFFTIMVASAAAPFGILIQKILWLIYSVYTFFTGIVIFILVQAKPTIVQETINGVSQNVVKGVDLASVYGWIVNYVINPLYGASKASGSVILGNMAKNADGPTAVLLIVVSIFVFVIAVVKGDFLTHWLAKEKADADLMKFQGDVERQAAKRRVEAADTKE
ncbi:MAG: hypothetical protein Q7R87_00950 [Nanoarchaeota archaeon]|nr:hypothetical protein [Nanoarchaeota archaeon]